MTQKTRQAVLERDSFDGHPCCIYCGSPSALHLHHVKRRSQLGTDEKENLVTLCYECHAKLHSGNKDIQEYAEKYLRVHYEGASSPRASTCVICGEYVPEGCWVCSECEKNPTRSTK